MTAASSLESAARRGHGATAHDILRKLHLGLPWAEVSAEVFGGTGSMGNGAVMRVAPLGVVGRLVALSAGRDSLPAAWLRAREPLQRTV